MEADEDYYLPLQDQRVFGAGIKRKRVNFVPASTPDPSQSAATSQTDKTDIGSRYLSIVLPKTSAENSGTSTPEVSATALEEYSTERPPSTPSPDLCPICSQPVSSPSAHESSLAHQLCLTHVHPPSHLPRSHMGLRYLTNHGWDPDARKGLGSGQQGITVPIKAKEKNDTAGLRERVDEDERPTGKKVPGTKKEEKANVAKLNAKGIRIRDLAAKKRAEMLRANFYGPDLEKYLGPDASQPG